MSGAATKYSADQLRVARKIGEVLRAMARVMPDLDLMMSMADHDVRDRPGFGTTLDAVAEFELPEWRRGVGNRPGMGRSQWSAIVIPDPDSATKTAFPRYGVLRPSGVIQIED